MTTMTPKNILAGLDLTNGLVANGGLTDADQSMVDQVFWLAQKSDASVHFVYVRPVKAGFFATQPAADPKTAQSVEAVMDELAQRGAETGVHVRTTVREGNVWDELMLEITATGADLFALSAGAHRQRLFRKNRKGKVARRAVKHSPIPVWLIAPSARIGIERVLVPIGHSELAETCLQRSRNLRGMADSEVLLLHCVTYPDDLDLKRRRQPRAEIQAYRDSVKRTAVRDIVSMLDESEASGFKIAVSELDVQTAVPNCAEKEAVDLVVIGSTGHKGLLGDTALTVVNRMNTSVWVQRPISC
jgi:nucleotide-binding universal stress UspA family protein